MFSSRFSSLFVLIPLFLVGCNQGQDDIESPIPGFIPKKISPAARKELIAHSQFMEGQDQRKIGKDFPAMLAAGKVRLKANPRDVDAWCTMGYAAYMEGDLPTAESYWKKGIQLVPARKGELEVSLGTAQGIQKRWPGLHLLPPVWADKEEDSEARVWGKKAVDLLNAHKYDEIEVEANRLQASKAMGTDGSWDLGEFAVGLWNTKGESDALWKARLAQIQAWRQARPNSLLAKVAEMACWTEGAQQVRGDDFADKVSAAQWQTMNERIRHGAGLVPELEASIKKSPLVAVRLQEWGQLASMPRDHYLRIVNEATSVFPDYLTCDIDAAIFLMTRWSGQPGDWEKYATQRADKMGGIKGDILYARIAGDQCSYYPHFWEQNAVSWPRVKRGCEAMLQQHPDSLSIGTSYFLLAYHHDEKELAQNLMIHVLRNRAARGTWKTLGGFGETRMEVLSVKM